MDDPGGSQFHPPYRAMYNDVRTSDLDYHLPRELIAQYPTQRRDESRLLVLHRDSGRIEHRRFLDLPEYLRPGDCLVLNDTRVIPARLLGRRIPSGGRVEALLLSPVGGWGSQEGQVRDEWYALVKPGARLRQGARVDFSGENGPRLVAEITSIVHGQRGLRTIRLDHDLPFDEVLAAVGHVPLPPYIARPDEPVDHDRYQTIYAERPGAVAAPTAGLHFTSEMLETLVTQGVRIARITLHVGLGTFRPITTQRLAEHRMDAEWMAISERAAQEVNRARASGGRIVAVGTTCVRALESAADMGGTVRPQVGETDLFIAPGYEFKAVDVLLTNFHLPRSTLVALVGAFVGLRRLLHAYEEAIRLGYRFYSYGDAMLLI